MPSGQQTSPLGHGLEQTGHGSIKSSPGGGAGRGGPHWSKPEKQDEI